MKRLVTGSLLLTLAVFQFQIWFGKSSVRALGELETRLQVQQAGNQQLLERNEQLKAEVKDLQNGNEALEERARSDLGMIGEGETFYLIVE
ncbi:MAG: septum formation initiator family protein [Gammaproteobacteria bacterium]|nr:septum formation initiator family protein [Pseudomonadales bacterium]MCP5346403.1 septum formation initiator family protein [Pseudomonadales bacterium]